MKNQIKTLAWICTIILNLCSAGISHAQVGIGTTTPDASAILDLTSTTKGILITRVTLIQRNVIISPATGLLIFQTDNSPGYYYNAGTPGVPNWVRLFSGSSAGGWDLSGNAGTTVGTNFLGTTDAQDFAIYTNNAEKVRVTSGGNVGIGTTAPASNLHVAGSQRQIRISDNEDSDGLWTIGTSTAVDNTSLVIEDDAANPRMTISEFGKVGIGTTDPVAVAPFSKLTVVGDGEYGQVTAISYSPTPSDYAGVFMVFGSRGSAASPIALVNTDRFGLLLAHGYDGDSYPESASIDFRVDGTVSTTDLPSSISFSTTNDGSSSRTRKMIITNAGNVGIGTISPEGELHIEASDTDTRLVLKNTDVGGETYYLQAMGDDIAGRVGNFEIWKVSGQNMLTIQPGGNVGIGTISPGAKLEVAGQIKITGGTPGTGKVLTSDAAGLATWNTPTNGDITGVIAGTGLTGGGTTGSVTVNAVGDNGLTTNANDIDFGGTLNQATTITQGANKMTFNLNGTGDFDVQDNGVSALFVRDDGNVGIGTIAPSTKLQVAGEISTTLISNQLNYRVGNDAAIWDVNMGNTLGIYGIQDPTVGSMKLGSGGPIISGFSGNVGIGTTTPTQRLTVFNGITTGTYTTAGWVHSSDARLKTNVKPILNALDKVSAINGVYFNWLKIPDSNKQIGFIAQEVQKILPEVVVKDTDGKYGIAYGNLTAVLVNAIKELKAENDAMKVELDEIKKIIGMQAEGK
ncbi:MAG: tail fiber domain-containing protein [Flavobacteriales bacterium]|nr:tail fiber domain-containing protein [Flavobacteriales bacterium]